MYCTKCGKLLDINNKCTDCENNMIKKNEYTDILTSQVTKNKDEISKQSEYFTQLPTHCLPGCRCGLCYFQKAVYGKTNAEINADRKSYIDSDNDYYNDD